MMYLSLICLKSSDVSCMHASYRLIYQKCFLQNCFVLACVRVCWLMVNCVTWKTERHVNKPLFTLRFLLWQEGRWHDGSSGPESSQTILLMRSGPVWPPATITHWTERPPCCRALAPFPFAPRSLCFTCPTSTSPQPSFYPQTSAYSPVVRCRKLILKYVHSSCLTHT